MSDRQYLKALAIMAGSFLLTYLAFVFQPTRVLASTSRPGMFQPRIYLTPIVSPRDLQQAFPVPPRPNDPFSGQVKDLGPRCLYVTNAGTVYAVDKAALALRTAQPCP